MSKEQKQCFDCGIDLGYSQEEIDFDNKVLAGECYCESGKPLKNCHPEYHRIQCGNCECAGEIQD